MNNEQSPPRIGYPLIRLGEVDSTNDWLQEATSKSAPPEGLTVLADSQRAGKGQFGSSWHDMPGLNLLFSVWLTPRFLPPAEQFDLARVGALALYRVLSPHFPDLRIKWPNDLLLGERKVAGMLIQNSLQGERMRSCILGIGLNVNQVRFPDTLPGAGSLALASGRTWDREALLADILAALDRLYRELRQGRREALRREYHHALYRLDIPARYGLPDGNTFTGILRGVNPEGLLEVEVPPDPGLQTFSLKGISFL